MHTLTTLGLIGGAIAIMVGLFMGLIDMSENFETGETGRTGSIGCAAVIGGAVVFVVSLAGKVLL